LSSFKADCHRLLGACLVLAACGLAGPAMAIGDGSKLEVAQIRYAGNWDSRPRAALVLAQEIRRRTSIDVRLERIVVDIDDPRLFYRPLLLLLGDGRLRFTDKERGRLKTWIEAGGFLLIDNTGRSEPSTAFDSSVRAEMSAMFPGRGLVKVPPEHVVFRTFFKLGFPWGRAIHRPFIEGLFIDGRIAVLYTQNDLTGALDRDKLGAFTFDVSPNEEAREKAIRFAVNLVQYAMCLDYKDDQVHLDYLLHRRRWRIKPPEIKAP
jgi:hypothetical protein